MIIADSRDVLHELEPYVDTNIYCGPYPFRPLPAADPEGLRSLLAEAHIETAVVTPFPALFHTRSWSGMTRWIDAFHGDARISFWAVVNPSLPGWEEDLQTAAETLSVAGVRLFPRCHGYPVFSPAVISLLESAAELTLPVCLTARLLDDRLYPRMMRVDPPMSIEEVGALLKRFPDIRWVLNGFSMPEIRALKPALQAAPGALVDIGLSKPFEPWWASLAELLPPERMVLGTGAPLYYHAGTRLSLHRSEIDPEGRRRILHVNGSRLLAERRIRSREVARVRH